MWSAQRIPMAINLNFLYWSCYFFIQVAPQLPSQGWVNTVPDPLLLRNSGSAGNRTWDFWICSQELWPLDHRGSWYRFLECRCADCLHWHGWLNKVHGINFVLIRQIHNNLLWKPFLLILSQSKSLMMGFMQVTFFDSDILFVFMVVNEVLCEFHWKHNYFCNNIKCL
jgi:hypothetical protein